LPIDDFCFLLGESCAARIWHQAASITSHSISSRFKRTAVAQPAFLARTFFLPLVALVFRSAPVHVQALILQQAQLPAPDCLCLAVPHSPDPRLDRFPLLLPKLALFVSIFLAASRRAARSCCQLRFYVFYFPLGGVVRRQILAGELCPIVRVRFNNSVPDYLGSYPLLAASVSSRTAQVLLPAFIFRMRNHSCCDSGSCR
jgi:hypothetical protein